MDPRTLVPILERSYPRYLEELRELVDLDCGSYTPEGVNVVADHCHAWFTRAGWEVARHHPEPDAGRPQLGDVVVGTVEGARPVEDGGRRFVLVGHMDTVFPEGTAAARPLRVEGDRAFGPGVNDMKSGLLTGFHALDALREVGWDGFARITFVCNPDEEIGSPVSKPIIREAARGADACFVLEAARPTGAIVSERKGVAEGVITVIGRAAHAGVEPEKGISAIEAGSRLVLALHALNGRWDGVTVNAGVVRGGTRPNVVAERFEVVFDVRSPREEWFQAVESEIRSLVASPALGATAELVWDVGFPPMERNERGARLAATAREVAAVLGFDLQEASTGGASDANTVAAMGVPTLDGLGPVGGDPHSAAEWLDLTSIVPRTALLGGLIAEVAG